MRQCELQLLVFQKRARMPKKRMRDFVVDFATFSRFFSIKFL